jgi:hypothetical protein
MLAFGVAWSSPARRANDLRAPVGVVATVPLQITRHSPLPTRHSPLSTRPHDPRSDSSRSTTHDPRSHPPLSTHHPPPRHPPLATRHPPSPFLLQRRPRRRVIIVLDILFGTTPIHRAGIFVAFPRCFGFNSQCQRRQKIGMPTICEGLSWHWATAVLRLGD